MAVDLRERISPAEFAKTLALSVIGPGLGVGLLLTLARATGELTFSGGSAAPVNALITLIVIFPLVQGLVFGARGARWKVAGYYALAALLIYVADLAAGFLILREGAICLIMGLPILMASCAIGLAVGRAIGGKWRGRVVEAGLVPLLVLAAIVDSQGGMPVYANAISDAVTIEAPPDYVWRYIASYPENDHAPEYWLWKLGLPAPLRSVAVAPEVGAARECRFSGGLAFKEEITEIVPDKVLVFKVTQQPDDPELMGHFNLDKGQLYLERNGDGSTTVIATSWYRLFVEPAFYFDWWASENVRAVHFRVLDHVKRLAEADWRRERAGRAL